MGKRRSTHSGNHATVWGLGEYRNGTFNATGLLNINWSYLYVLRMGYFLHHGPLSNPGSARFPQHGHPSDLWRDLLEELKPLSG